MSAGPPSPGATATLERAAGPDASSPAELLLAIARSTLAALIEIVPRAVWRGFKGALAGFFLTGALGLLIAGAGAGANRLGALPQPTWLLVTNLVWVPFALAIAGGYVGGIHGFLATLAEEVEQRGLAVRLFALVKPVCASVARRARGGGESGDLAADLRAALTERLDDDRAPKSASLAERAERALAARSRRLLCFSVLRTVVTAPDRESAVRELESFGTERLAQILTDTIEDLFSAQTRFAAALALIAAAAPTLVLVALR